MHQVHIRSNLQMSILTLDALHTDFPDKRWQELRFTPDCKISDLKQRLQRCTGTSTETMKVYAFDESLGMW